MSDSVRRFSTMLTADVNEKGVLDVDTVKGCAAGMSARRDGGCYNACYAATIAKFRGLDFTHSVTRTVQNKAQADQIVRAVKAAPEGFFRIGTMGDPCHAWETTVETIEWLSPYAVPVIITKHWIKATDEQLLRLIACGTVLNTSISALDTPAELRHREREIARYSSLGGHSIARIVSCDFDPLNSEGARMAQVQERLFAYPHVIDNPLRVYRTHKLVQDGVIKLSSVKDLSAVRTISIANVDTYIGHCSDCKDKCGLSSMPKDHPVPLSPQSTLFMETA